MIHIKSKADYPYIYLLVEPNLVFVYRIETQQYITISDMNVNKLEAFEMENDDFQTFNFKERHSIEGRGFFVNQEDMVKMVEEINKHIQIIRNGAQTGPVHIVTSESAAGSLRASLPRPKTVIGFPDSFSVGPLWRLNEKVGQDNRKEWLFDHINYESEDYEYESKFANTLREIDDIPDDIPIYIWYGDNPDEQIGLRFYLYLLKEKPNEVFLINSTVEGKQFFHTGQLDSNLISQLFERNKGIRPMTKNERDRLCDEWEKLSQTRELLRIWSNEEIKGVPFVLASMFGVPGEQEFEEKVKLWKLYWLDRTALNQEAVDNMEDSIRNLSFLSEEEIRSLLEDSGFTRITKFMETAMFGSWICYKQESED